MRNMGILIKQNSLKFTPAIVLFHLCRGFRKSFFRNKAGFLAKAENPPHGSTRTFSQFESFGAATKRTISWVNLKFDPCDGPSPSGPKFWGILLEKQGQIFLLKLKTLLMGEPEPFLNFWFWCSYENANFWGKIEIYPRDGSFPSGLRIRGNLF